MDDFRRDLDVVRDVFNDAFSTNWHFLPATLEEHLFSAKYLSLVTDPSLVTIVEHHGKAVGVLMCVVDVNPVLQSLGGKAGPLSYMKLMRGKKRMRTLVVYAVGIRKAYQRTRAYVLLCHALLQTSQGFDILESTWMSPGNVLAVAASRRMGMVEHKHFRIYRKSLCNGDMQGIGR